MNKLQLSVALVALAAAFGAQAAMRDDLLGEPVPTSTAARTIELTPSTRYVNVAAGETVNFVADGQSFAVKFDGPNAESFDLQRMAPAGALDHAVTAYVTPSLRDGDGRSGRGR